MTTFRKGTAGTVAAIAVAFTVAALTTGPSTPGSMALSKKQGPVIDAPCDVDGVDVSYDSSYRSTPATAGYRVVTASVSGVAPTCVNATLTVRMMAGSTLLATGTATASSTVVSVPFNMPASAREVTGVQVELAGGTTPIPAECNGITFARFAALTTGNDNDPGSKDNDLVYGLEGNDTLRGDNQTDCLVGQAGTDNLFGDNHDDVLIGGADNDVLTGGSGDDKLYGGPGTNDRCIGGPGKNTFSGCEVIQ